MNWIRALRVSHQIAAKMFSLACLPHLSAWVQCHALAPLCSFVLMQTPGGSRDGSSN